MTDASEAEKQSQKQHEEDSQSEGTTAASSEQAAGSSTIPFLLLRYEHLPCQDHQLLDHHLPHPYRLPVFLLGVPPGVPPG